MEFLRTSAMSVYPIVRIPPIVVEIAL